MDIIYDHEAEHFISDVPKHSSNGGLNPLEFLPSPLVRFSPLNSENPKFSLDGQIFRKFSHFCLSNGIFVSQMVYLTNA